MTSLFPRAAIRILLCLALFCLLAYASVSSQSVTANNDLSFGTVFAGVPKSVSAKTAGAAAEFLITGNAGDEVAIDFTLPKYMSQGGYHMPMIFLETDCALDSSSSPDQSNPGVENLDPWQTINYRIGSSGITLWLGGTLVPNLGQPPGSYSAFVTVTVAYTGN